ncbi:MAG: hypothetical protein LBJ13_01505 [Puniceicoccales bacterium]|nr:hypothetical protein [Puniceicoccales bacterium]
MKQDSRYLVIDAGSGKVGTGPLPQYMSKMQSGGSIHRRLNALGGQQDCIFLVTHNHQDHFCLFRYLGNFFNRIRAPIWIEKLAKSFWSSFSKTLEVVGCVPRDYLGEDVSISCLVPPKNAKEVHENNLIVFVKYGKVLFILPGDADGDYLNLNAGAFMAKLSEESNGCTHCCIVLPHHGSNSNGTLALTLAAHRVLLENECGEVIFIISSNPMENDRLPRPAVLPLLPHMPQVTQHNYRHSNGRLSITSPVFITCEATDGAGYLVTTDGDNLHLFDGTTPIPDRLLYPVQ